MKKINWLMTLLLAVMFSFAACTGSAESTEEAAEETVAEEVSEEMTVSEADTAAMEVDSMVMDADSTAAEEQEASTDAN